MMEKTVGGAVESGGKQEFSSKYTKFDFHMKFLIRDVKCKIECLELREKERLEIKILEVSAKIGFQSHEIG